MDRVERNGIWRDLENGWEKEVRKMVNFWEWWEFLSTTINSTQPKRNYSEPKDWQKWRVKENPKQHSCYVYTKLDKIMYLKKYYFCIFIVLLNFPKL